MLKKKMLIGLQVSLLCLTSVGTVGFAQGELKNFPEFVQGEFRSEPNKEEIDLMNEGRIDIPKEPQARKILPDGTLRLYSNVNLTTTTKKDTYNFLGEASYYNNTSRDAKLQYSQEVTKTTRWDVTSNISASTEVSAPFLAKVEGTVGVSVGSSNTVSRSSRALAEMTVSPGKTGSIAAYNKAVYAGGTIAYKDYYSSTGRPKGSGTEVVRGYVVRDGNLHFVASEI